MPVRLARLTLQQPSQTVTFERATCCSELRQCAGDLPIFGGCLTSPVLRYQGSRPAPLSVLQQRQGLSTGSGFPASRSQCADCGGDGEVCCTPDVTPCDDGFGCTGEPGVDGSICAGTPLPVESQIK